jgi:hypothetical protein
MKKVVPSRILALFMVLMIVVLSIETRAQEPITPPHLLYSAPVALAWEPANDPNVTGYAIYFGPTNQPATNRIYAGPSTTVTLFNLLANVSYQIYAVSCNADGIESEPSNQLLLTFPALSRVKVVPQPDGSMLLNCKAAPGTTCQMLFTSTLHPEAWQTLATVTADSAGNVVALDATASQADRRFYRVTLP